MPPASLRHRSGLRLAHRQRLLNEQARGRLFDAMWLLVTLASLLVVFCAGAAWR